MQDKLSQDDSVQIKLGESELMSDEEFDDILRQAYHSEFLPPEPLSEEDEDDEELEDDDEDDEELDLDDDDSEY